MKTFKMLYYIPSWSPEFQVELQSPLQIIHATILLLLTIRS